MTRLDATSEPSMEDILASIRKIIAEDPPGSRPAPTASAPQAQPVQQTSTRAPERDRSFPFAGRSAHSVEVPSSQPSFAASEPYLKPSPQNTAPQNFNNEPFFSPAASEAPLAAANAATSRIEPSFGPMAGAPANNLDRLAEPSTPANSAGASVDEQLSDLLGESASVEIKPAIEPKIDPAPASGGGWMPAKGGFGDRMAGRFNKPAEDLARTSIAAADNAVDPKVQDERPGFTVARDGFIAPQNSGSTSTPVEADPFEFDLGPSPFQAKAAAPSPSPAPTGNSLTARMSASSLERISAPSTAATVVGTGIAEKQDDAAIVSDSADVVAATSSDTGDTAADSAQASVVSTVAVVAAPSVAATLAPKAAESAPVPEPVGRFIPANAGVAPAKSVDRDVLEVVAPQRSQAESPPIEVVRVAPEVEPQEQAASSPSTSTAITVHHANGDMRTMEETVAELLRPMLKTWLAENMPRIVERALRRELSEQMMIDKKAAAE